MCECDYCDSAIIREKCGECGEDLNALIPGNGLDLVIEVRSLNNLQKKTPR